MSNRFWDHIRTLVDGQTARTTPVNNQFDGVMGGFDKVASEMNRTFRFTAGAPDEPAFQINQTPAQRANQLLGFDVNGNPQLRAGSFTWRGNWAGGTFYSVNDMVRAPAAQFRSLYVAIVAHNSTDFPADLAAGRWALAVDLQEMSRFIRAWQIVNTSRVAVSGDDLFVDVSAGPIAITLPATPALSDQPITVCHVAGNVVANPITILRNGKPIQGLLEDMLVNTPEASFELAFCNDATGWRLVKGT